MRRFFDRWYGDRCPFWTWPVTWGAIIIACMVAIFTIEHLEQLACEAKGGNDKRPSGCYLVTMKKID
jgi:hypothetical protein